jgi:hypothetical protein
MRIENVNAMSSLSDYPPGDNGCSAGIPPGLDREWLEGLLYCHSRMNANTNKILEVASFAYALIELLVEKGLITLKELDDRKIEVCNRLKQKFTERGMGMAVLDDNRNKYGLPGEKAVDCFSRLHLCKAICCRFGVALSRQDVEEGRLRWDPGQPYMIAKDEQGYCRHLDRKTFTCTVRDCRPIACREYDCRKDSRVWEDYEKRVLSPDAETLFSLEGRQGLRNC